MTGVNEIQKLNATNRADLANSRDGTFAVLRCGGILLRNGLISKTIDDKVEAAAFLAKVRDKGTGYVKTVVQSYFTPVSA